MNVLAHLTSTSPATLNALTGTPNLGTPSTENDSRTLYFKVLSVLPMFNYGRVVVNLDWALSGGYYFGNGSLTLYIKRQDSTYVVSMIPKGTINLPWAEVVNTTMWFVTLEEDGSRSLWVKASGYPYSSFTFTPTATGNLDFLSFHQDSTWVESTTGTPVLIVPWSDSACTYSGTRTLVNAVFTAMQWTEIGLDVTSNPYTAASRDDGVSLPPGLYKVTLDLRASLGLQSPSPSASLYFRLGEFTDNFVAIVATAGQGWVSGSSTFTFFSYGSSFKFYRFCDISTNSLHGLDFHAQATITQCSTRYITGNA